MASSGTLLRKTYHFRRIVESFRNPLFMFYSRGSCAGYRAYIFVCRTLSQPIIWIPEGHKTLANPFTVVDNVIKVNQPISISASRNKFAYFIPARKSLKDGVGRHLDWHRKYTPLADSGPRTGKKCRFLIRFLRKALQYCRIGVIFGKQR